MCDTNTTRKRKIKNPSDKAKKTKVARLKEEACIDHKGNNVDTKKPQFTCSCEKQCLDNLGEENCMDVFSKFSNIPSEYMQDLFLLGLIDILEIKRRRPRDKTNPKIVRNGSYVYHAVVGTKRTHMCKRGFISIFAINEKRVRRIIKLKLAGKTPQDRKGQNIVQKDEPYIGNDVDEKKPQFSCGCENQCLDNLGEENCMDVFSKFSKIPSKYMQDMFLQGLIDILEIKRRRPRDKANPKIVRNGSYVYHAVVGTKRTRMCKKGFISIFAVNEKRVRRIIKLKIAGKAPEKKRRRNTSHPLSTEVNDSNTKI